MPNTNAPFGFRAFGHRDGNAPTMGQMRFTINSSDPNSYFTGDLVALSSATPGTLQPFFGSSLVPLPLGVFNGCEYYSPSVARQVWSQTYLTGAGAASSTPVTAYVVTDTDMLYIGQVSSANIASSNSIGSLVAISTAAGPGNSLTGQSGMTISSSYGIAGAASSLPWRIIDSYANTAPFGANGTDNSSAQFYGILVLAPNNWVFNAGTIGPSS
jgi:hypothetical protein